MNVSLSNIDFFNKPVSNLYSKLNGNVSTVSFGKNFLVWLKIHHSFSIEIYSEVFLEREFSVNKDLLAIGILSSSKCTWNLLLTFLGVQEFNYSICLLLTQAWAQTISQFRKQTFSEGWVLYISSLQLHFGKNSSTSSIWEELHINNKNQVHIRYNMQQ
jgi:hypothetical protein